MDPQAITYLNDRRYPRLIQYNNPGNIHSKKQMFEGQLEFVPSATPKVCKFFKYHHGVYALVSILHHRYHCLKLQTLADMFKSWTPTRTTNTALLKAVETGMGISRHQNIEWEHPQIHLLTSEICRYNCKQDPRITSALFAYVWLQLN